MKNKERFIELMEKLYVIYGQIPNEKRTLYYWRYLKDTISDARFEFIVDVIIKNESFFPSIAVFLKTDKNYVDFSSLKKGVDY